MTHAAPSPEDRQQLEALAGRLADLQPAAASGSLQAQAFYRAGMQAARAESDRRSAAHRWLARAAVVGLMLGSSGFSYWAGVSRSAGMQIAETSLTADSDLQTDSQLGPSSRRPTDALAREQSTAPKQVADDLVSKDPASALNQVAFRLPIANWLRLPRVTPEEYLRLVEARTTPVPASHTADDVPPIARPTEESLLRELYGTPPPSPLRQWLPML